MSRAEITKVFNTIDKDGNGEIDYSLFLETYLTQKLTEAF